MNPSRQQPLEQYSMLSHYSITIINEATNTVEETTALTLAAPLGEMHRHAAYMAQDISDPVLCIINVVHDNGQQDYFDSIAL